MRGNDTKKFLEKNEETIFGGLKQLPVEIIDLGKELGLSENISLDFNVF